MFFLHLDKANICHGTSGFSGQCKTEAFFGDNIALLQGDSGKIDFLPHQPLDQPQFP